MSTSYLKKFLQSAGQPCTILRTPEVETKVSLRRSTRAIRDYGAREAHFEATFMSEVNIESGELVEISGDRYLVQTSMYDHATTERLAFIVKTNAKVNLYRLSESADSDLNVVQGWSLISSDVDVYGEIVTAELRNRDPGILEATRYTFHVPDRYGFQMLDRLVFNGENYRIDAINNVGMQNVSRIQVALDRRA